MSTAIHPHPTFRRQTITLSVLPFTANAAATNSAPLKLSKSTSPSSSISPLLVPTIKRKPLNSVVYRPIADRPESFFLELCMLCYRPNQKPLVSRFEQIVQSFY
jgi:hypothetical protein